jgi:hypothetical protein
VATRFGVKARGDGERGEHHRAVDTVPRESVGATGMPAASPFKGKRVASLVTITPHSIGEAENVQPPFGGFVLGGETRFFSGLFERSPRLYR